MHINPGPDNQLLSIFDFILYWFFHVTSEGHADQKFTFDGFYCHDLAIVGTELDAVNTGKKLLEVILNDPGFVGSLADNIQQVIIAQEVEASEIGAFSLQIQYSFDL